MIHWLGQAVHTYVFHPLTGYGYQWWSGAGSDLGEASILTALIVHFRHHNCHRKGCWRLGHQHPDPKHPGHGLPVCRKHWNGE